MKFVSGNEIGKGEEEEGFELGVLREMKSVYIWRNGERAVKRIKKLLWNAIAVFTLEYVQIAFFPPQFCEIVVLYPRD